MMNYYPLILGLIDILNDWNEKLNSLVEGRLDNVLVGTIVLVAIFVISAWGINTLNK